MDHPILLQKGLVSVTGILANDPYEEPVIGDGFRGLIAIINPRITSVILICLPTDQATTQWEYKPIIAATHIRPVISRVH